MRVTRIGGPTALVEWEGWRILTDPTFGYMTSPSNTYALMLTNSGGASNLGLGLTNSNVFPFGATNFGFNDWAFAQLVVAPTNPVPESSTVASVAAGLLVAGLVGYRLRQRRNQAAEVAPLAAA